MFCFFFKNAHVQFFPNRPVKHVITSTNYSTCHFKIQDFGNLFNCLITNMNTNSKSIKATEFT